MGKRVSAADALAGNVQRLMDHYGLSQAELGRKAGVGQSTLSGLLDTESSAKKNPRATTVDKLAAYFKVEPWQLLVPGMPLDLLLNDRVAQLVKHYRDAPESGRQNIERVAESEVRYATAAALARKAS